MYQEGLRKEGHRSLYTDQIFTPAMTFWVLGTRNHVLPDEGYIMTPTETKKVLGTMPVGVC